MLACIFPPAKALKCSWVLSYRERDSKFEIFEYKTVQSICSELRNQTVLIFIPNCDTTVSHPDKRADRAQAGHNACWLWFSRSFSAVLFVFIENTVGIQNAQKQKALSNFHLQHFRKTKPGCTRM